MKFSYYLLKKLVPEIKNPNDAIEKLTLYSFEVDDLGDGIFDIGISPNRFSDAASHFGLAREIAAALKVKLKLPESVLINNKSSEKNFEVSVLDSESCPRYSGVYFDLEKIGKSPKWMEKVLIDCGLRPINAVVDIMNYVMLETGQPLHAFDYDKLSKKNGIPKLIVRRAKKGEKITTLDNRDCDLDQSVLVIADEENSLAIAGIKGGKFAEVDEKTKIIIVEAANFERSNIYKTAKNLKIFTDASSRFSHDLAPELTELGLGRAAILLKEICGGKVGQIVDTKKSKSTKKVIAFDTNRFRKFIGVNFSDKEIKDCLQRLDFKCTVKKDNKNYLLVEIPVLRPDVEGFEDLSEEVIRLYGLNEFEAKPPHVFLNTSGFEDQVILRDKIGRILLSFGFSKVRNYSFASEKDIAISESYKDFAVEIENPISANFQYLRTSLAPHILKNIENNLRFFEEVKIFEIGKVFKKINGAIFEPTMLAMTIVSKDKKKIFFETKGVLQNLFNQIGLVNYSFDEAGENSKIIGESGYLRPSTLMEINSGGKTIGFFGKAIGEWNGKEADIVEINFDELLKLVEEENEYQPLPKYPSSVRDISVLIDSGSKIGQIILGIQNVDRKYIQDVDLIDEYEDKNLKDARSLTFRIVFQADDRTLTETEINGLMEKITELITKEFKASIR